MKSYHAYINESDTFSYTMGKISQIPSPKQHFLCMLIRSLNVTPNYLRMILCSTSSGKTLSESNQIMVSKILQTSREVLFPSNPNSPGSLVNIYANLPNKSQEYTELLADIQKATGASYSSISKWATGKHKPSKWRRNAIANLLGRDVNVLFPE